MTTRMHPQWHQLVPELINLNDDEHQSTTEPPPHHVGASTLAYCLARATNVGAERRLDRDEQYNEWAGEGKDAKEKGSPLVPCDAPSPPREPQAVAPEPAGPSKTQAVDDASDVKPNGSDLSGTRSKRRTGDKSEGAVEGDGDSDTSAEDCRDNYGL